MKLITYLLVVLFVFTQTLSTAQEGTKIPFDKGVLKLCSSKNFIIKGYDGNEVIIKNLHKNIKSNVLYKESYNNLRNKYGTIIYRNRDSISRTFPSRGLSQDKIGKAEAFTASFTRKQDDRVVDSLSYNYVLFNTKNKKQSKGLKSLGKKAAAKKSGVYLKIEQTENELIIKDDIENLLIMNPGEKYEITIPNSIRINWDTSGCTKKSRSYFFNSNTSEIKNFKGEVEISSSVNNFNLIDVSGPVSINTIGGNVIVKFDKTTPNKLYSIYSNNGYIDITLPKASSLSVDATAAEILSDLDFKVVSEKEINGTQQMNLKLGTGKVKMKLDANLGNIYLRKQ